MNILLIIHHPDVQEKEKLHARIEAYSESSYFIYENIAIVKTDFNTKELYDKFTEEDFETAQMLIVFFSNKYLGFWGRMNVQLWQWLGQNEDNNTLSDSQEKEIRSLLVKIKELEAENKSLEGKIAYSQTRSARKAK